MNVSLCPSCGDGVLNRFRVGGTELFSCSSGCAGRRIAFVLGVDMPNVREMGNNTSPEETAPKEPR
jgi:hypothetical protein